MRRDVDTDQPMVTSEKASLAELSSRLAGATGICSQAFSERDELLEPLQAAEIRHEEEVAQMQATIVKLQRQAAYWEEQAKTWQNNYSRVAQDFNAVRHLFAISVDRVSIAPFFCTNNPG
ncbi:hypothetical protein B0H11DRAFT_2221983 [Mycena galericulata]|nr:hypothetical protein B0H11DRAFT_2221983 [Mycena galericulata]